LSLTAIIYFCYTNNIDLSIVSHIFTYRYIANTGKVHAALPSSAPVVKSHLYILKSSPPQTKTCWSGCREAELIGLEISYSFILSNLQMQHH